MLGIGFLFLTACNPEEKIDVPQDDYALEVPSYFPEPLYGLGNKALNKEGVELGRKLFYDPILSVNGKVSCASCHHQASGFSDEGKIFSEGVNGNKGFRNSPALSNLAWIPFFLADGGINHIEVMPLAPLTDSLEMADDLNNILNKLKADGHYRVKFQKAFNDTSITTKQMLVALSQFMSSMVSANSKYDKVMQGVKSFTEVESKGFELFQAKCASCHVPPLFTDFSYRNNGLAINYSDEGRARITRKPEDEAKFKVPSLRNVSLSKPYMHNGSIQTLAEVVEHYNSGIVSHRNLDKSLQNGIALSETETQQLIKFLETLTDYEYIANPLFSEPDE